MNALVKAPQTALTGKAAALVVEAKQYLTFMPVGEMFSLSILCIKEII